MKKLYLVVGFLLISSSYAYQAFNSEELKLDWVQNSEPLQNQIDARLPVYSKAKVGNVHKKKLETVDFSNPIFVIGDDPFSQHWLKGHAEELEKIKAIGFVTNISDSAHLHELQKMIKAPLLPSNVDDLFELFQVSNYPLIFAEGQLWQ